MEGWRTCKIGEICEIRRGASPRPILEFLCPEGIPWIKISDATSSGSRFISSTSEYIKPSGRSASVTVYPGDLILSNSATPGIPKFLNIEACIHDGWLLLRDFKGVTKNYLFYLLKQIRNGLVNQTTGSVFTNLKIDIVKEFEVDLPPLPIQNRIAEILGALDDKIELNRQMNHTLEQMAQAFYKHYFVDDIDPENLPEGWRVGKLDEVVNIRGGGTPSTTIPKYWNGSVHWTTPKDLSNLKSPFLTQTEKKLTELGLKKVSSGLLPERTILLSSRAPIGYIAIADIPVAINQGYIAILPDSFFREYFMYFWLKNNIDLVVQYANGSTFMEISKKAFREIESIIPPENAIHNFNQTTKFYFDLIKNSTYEIEQLIKTRDTLLPKLISGELIPADLQTIEQTL